MSSPVGIPFRSIIRLEKSKTPVFIQISRQLINAIQRGAIAPGARLPGSRTLAAQLGVHRKTVIAALEELYLQGWTDTRPGNGTFVTDKPPRIHTEFHHADQANLVKYPVQTGFRFPVSNLLDRPAGANTKELEFTDGTPDVRLSPLDKIGKAYRHVLSRKLSQKLLHEVHPEGNPFYRHRLAEYLNNTRGLPIGPDNILTTRGVQMGIYLAASLLLAPNDLVVVGDTSHFMANMIFQNARAEVITIPVDSDGISTEALRQLCKHRKVRMLYLTPHHHYPTTVTLSAERRVEILQLARSFGFVILEDDHDYDFHYQSSPLLPLASADTSGMVVYVGSFCKLLAPALRQGYLVAPENLIAELAKYRQIIDHQGDLIMEQALGELLDEGEIQRHLKKAVRIYRSRRDYFCQELQEALGGLLRFSPPPGGLAVWLEWSEKVSLLKTSQACDKNGLYLPQNLLFQTSRLAAARIGFGHLNNDELTKAVDILNSSVVMR